jgi:ribosomal-protein-alanine N-acetyltransferase
MLRNLAFERRRDWIGFALQKSRRLPPATVSGVRFRDGGPDDVPELLRIDAAAFPSPITPDGMAEMVQRGNVIIAETGKRPCGFCLFSQPDPGEGFINTLAVDEDVRGRGVGAALTVRAAKRLFAAGARQARLTTDDDNGNGIRLYVRLGFRQSEAGRDYVRPADPDAVQRMKAESKGIVIRFGGWR